MMMMMTFTQSTKPESVIPLNAFKVLLWPSMTFYDLWGQLLFNWQYLKYSVLYILFPWVSMSFPWVMRCCFLDSYCSTGKYFKYSVLYILFPWVFSPLYIWCPLMPFDELWWPLMAFDGLWWPLMAFDALWCPSMKRQNYELCELV